MVCRCAPAADATHPAPAASSSVLETPITPNVPLSLGGYWTFPAPPEVYRSADEHEGGSSTDYLDPKEERIGGVGRGNGGDEHGAQREQQSGHTSDQCCGLPFVPGTPAVRLRAQTQHQITDKQVEVGDEVDQEHRVQQDQIRLLHCGSFSQNREQQKERCEHRLGENRDVRRLPT